MNNFTILGNVCAPHAGQRQLVERGDLLQVHEDLEGEVAQQAGRHVRGGARARPLPVHQPRQRRYGFRERPQRLYHKAQSQTRVGACLTLCNCCQMSLGHFKSTSRASGGTVFVYGHTAPTM